MTSRHIHHPGNQQAVLQLEAELRTICGSAQSRSFVFDTKTYYNVEAEIRGTGNELVVIGAHLDSTAANDQFYQPDIHDAPGADDDWSGVKGVLTAARALRTLADGATPQRSIRFVLFNAEEQGMRGSRAYADSLKELEGSAGQPLVVAMIQLDMIGWHRPDGLPPFTFEIHGTGSSEYDRAKSASDQLVNTVAKAVISLSPAAVVTPQVYPLPDCDSDPASGRSDHSSFLYHDWAACLVCEDLWVETCGPQPAQSGNPYYHRSTDLEDQLDPKYAADIVRAVVGAAWMIASP